MIKVIRTCVILVAMLMVSNVVLAKTAAVSVPAATTPAIQLVNLLDEYHSLTANFEQGVYDANGTLVQNSSGNMAVQRPENFRWFTLKPNEQLIITDGKKLSVYDIDLQQVTVSKLQKKTGTTPAMLLTTSAQEMEQYYNVSIYPGPKTQQVYQLLPKVKNADFQWIRFFFENQQIHKMQIKDNIGQVTSITFENIKTNPVLPASTFKLTIPKGVDVIQE
ncbi:MAG: outer membrane lipoprotein chaperone LolA [Gammaproteobacteria bacterium]